MSNFTIGEQVRLIDATRDGERPEGQIVARKGHKAVVLFPGYGIQVLSPRKLVEA